MRFEAASGWIIGLPGQGLSAMFVMMNAARLHVAMQGLGLLEAAWQKASAYSQERRQMRAPGARSSREPADLIALHPAMQRILQTQRCWIDGGRLLAYRTAIELDLARQHPDPERRASAQRWCALTTPVLKAALTQQAFYGASECLQVFGGHGYIREWGIEQILRDARVTMIYEGTNEIQAIDLLLRKVLPDGGAALAGMLEELETELAPGRAADLAVCQRFAQLKQLTQAISAAASSDPALPYQAADDYLRLLALALLSWAWARIEAAAGPDNKRWQAPAALPQRVLPEFDMWIKTLTAQCSAAGKRSSDEPS